MKRRGFLNGVGSLLFAPAIVRASSIMPVSVVPKEVFSAAEYTLQVEPMAWGSEYFDNEVFSQLVTNTLREKQDELRKTVIDSNALFVRLKGRKNEDPNC